MKNKVNKNFQRKVRHARVRAVISGTAERPRLSVFKSLRGMYIQLIDDVKGKTVVGVLFKNIDTKKMDAGERKGKTAVAYMMGKLLAEKAKTAGITTIVFDRGGYKYQGRVQAVAEGARDGGLKF